MVFVWLTAFFILVTLIVLIIYQVSTHPLAAAVGSAMRSCKC
jgi:hypothetical protein